jgi:hypothetical protein
MESSHEHRSCRCCHPAFPRQWVHRGDADLQPPFSLVTITHSGQLVADKDVDASTKSARLDEGCRTSAGSRAGLVGGHLRLGSGTPTLPGQIPLPLGAVGDQDSPLGRPRAAGSRH